MLQYFELVFLQLQLIKFLCKLTIIWVNYEKQKWVLFMKHHVYIGLPRKKLRNQRDQLEVIT